MELYLSKIVNFFINPLYILFLIIFSLILIIFFINSKKLVIFFSKLFLILFLFFGYTPLSNFLLNKIEDYIQKFGVSFKLQKNFFSIKELKLII